MVKLKGPMVSLEAAGSLAGTLVFAKSGPVSYARKLTVPKQPLPLVQRAGRALTSFLAKQWSALSAAHRSTWDDADVLEQADGYRRFIGYNAERFHRGKPPSKLYPAPEIWGWPGIATWTVQSKNRRVDNGALLTADPHGWGMFISRHTAAFDDADLTHVTYIFPVPTNGTYVWFDSPLPAATYYYRMRPFSNGGIMRTYSALRTVVVTG